MLCLLSMGRFECFSVCYYWWSYFRIYARLVIVRLAIICFLTLFLFFIYKSVALCLCGRIYGMLLWRLLIVMLPMDCREGILIS